MNPPTANTNTFTGTSIENVTLHVPAASVDTYKAAEPWSHFKEIKAIQPLVDSSDTIEIPLTFEAIDGMSLLTSKIVIIIPCQSTSIPLMEDLGLISPFPIMIAMEWDSLIVSQQVK